MDKLLLTRCVSSNQGTFGVLSNGNEPLCVTCEDPWLDNRFQASCIPTGTYICQKYSSAKYPDVWEVRDVPGRSAILIHAGNTINDTQGCILVGKGFGELSGLPSITDSRMTLANLRALLPETFYLTVRKAI